MSIQHLDKPRTDAARAARSTNSLWLAGLILWAGVTAAMHVGKLPPLIPVLRLEMGLELVQGGFLLSVMQAVGMTMGLFAGLLADRLGLRRTLMCGLCLLGMGTLAGSCASSVDALLATRLLEGAGLLCTVLPAPGLLHRQVREPKALSRSLGAWGAYMPVGAALALLAGPVLYQLLGWRWAWALLGLVTFLWAWLVWRFLPPDPPRVITTRTPVVMRTLQSTLGAQAPWLLALAFFVYSGQWLAVVGFLPTIQSQAGWSLHLIATMSALVAGANAIGNVAAGQLLARGWRPGRVLALGYGVMGTASALAFGFVPDPVLQWMAVLAFSSLGGLIPGTLFGVVVRLAPGPDSVSTTVGWMQQLSSLGQFCGPPLVAFLVAREGGDWSPTWWVTVSCCLAGLVLAARLQSILDRGK